MDRRDRMNRDGGWRGRFGSETRVDEQKKQILVPLDEFEDFIYNFDCAEGFAQRLAKLAVTDGDDEDKLFLPFKFEYAVCGTCDGRGTHVNPSIDAHGISSDEFDDDPDFRENYFNGMYDVTCYECYGKRVVPNIKSVLPEFKKRSERREFNRALEAKLESDVASLSDNEIYALLEMHREDVAEDLAMMHAEMAAERRMGA